MEKLKRMNICAAQGELFLRVVEALPKNAVRAQDAGRVTVGHSETGHHHVIDDEGVVRYEIGDPAICYLQIDGVHADLRHLRSFDTHATVRLPGGGTIIEVRRQQQAGVHGRELLDD